MRSKPQGQLRFDDYGFPTLRHLAAVNYGYDALDAILLERQAALPPVRPALAPKSALRTVEQPRWDCSCGAPTSQWDCT
jgi:hypothetical protein